MQYNIQLINRCGRILANVTAINHNVSLYCTDVYTDANSVMMWATYNRIKGIESHAKLFLAASKPPITAMTSNKASFSYKGLRIFLISLKKAKNLKRYPKTHMISFFKKYLIFILSEYEAAKHLNDFQG